MSAPLIVALPSKGRLKEQVEAWLADCGLDLQALGGARGYLAGLKGLPGVQVRLLSAGDIAEALDSGETHLGVTGEDLLRERGPDVDARVLLLRALGFGRADLVVAAPKSWLDVETMADLEEVAHDFLARTGRRMRVATKYLAQTRAFFARHGIADYRIAESGGATEGAPAAGTAELVVDITTTGATLAANGLKTLADGTILKSQAQLAASLNADWSEGRLAGAERLLRIVEARAAARNSSTLVWPSVGSAAEAAVVERLAARGAVRRPNGLLVDSAELAEAALALAAVGLGPVTAARPDFVFEVGCLSFEALKAGIFDENVKER
jgi:ATP phosphoribosyltransferase